MKTQFQVLFIRDVKCADADKMQGDVKEVCKKGGIHVATVFSNTPMGKGLMAKYGVTATPTLVKIRWQEVLGEMLTGRSGRNEITRWVKRAIPR